ncbi:hypothetical protein BS47DRAFT_1375868 [Hydnum rufescens UP504]|uniref:Cyclin-dependent kinase 8 n=1 Tax=Hydnum rufescens UP504 TaxID=1448309 RepID=A0A9P6B3U7_9AGAM|nr:hypothetical protein BS47DRAFT_1375868 [Hydnum rufescens UP504]
MSSDPMKAYRARRDKARLPVLEKYGILGFISSAQSKDSDGAIYAIKKFKPDKEGEVVTYTGISQSACREIALNREIDNVNVIKLREVMLEDKSIYMVFEYAEHDFLQIIHHHSSVLRNPIPVPVIKSLLFQLLNGVLYLHNSHIMHRDLKPANILVTSSGVVKIGDLGLARLSHNPLQPLYIGDKVVVTIWYRAPELLMGSKHYTKAVDCWAIGCIFAELLSLRPIFKGEEAKLDSKKNVPFQKDQVIKIFEVLGTPDLEQWPGLIHMPEYPNMLRLEKYRFNLQAWVNQRLQAPLGYELIGRLFDYDPTRRITAKEALTHKWFATEPRPTKNAFLSLPSQQPYPLRRVTNDEAPTMVAHLTQTTTSRPPTGGGAGSTFHRLPQQSQANTNNNNNGHAGNGAVAGANGGGGGPARKKPRLQ